MKRSTNEALAALALLASIGGLGGCETTGSYDCFKAPPLQSQSRVRFPAPGEEKGAAESRPPAVADLTPPVVLPNRREPGAAARVVGMFGDLAPNGPSADDLADGTRNISQVTRFTEGACFDPEVNRTGTMLAFASTVHGMTSDIYTKSVSGATVRKITSDPGNDVMPSISPDQQTLAFASDRSGNWDIYLTDLEGARPRQLTNDPEHEIHPTWSPDASRIAYCKFGSQSQRWEIWLIDLSKPGVQSFLTYGMYPQWSPDPTRNKILFQRARERGSRLFGVWTIDLVGDEATNLTEIVSAGNAAVMHPAWSPDGGRVVFVTVVDPDPAAGAMPGRADLWVINVDGSGRVALTDGENTNFQPTWGRDGLIYFVSNRSGVDNLWSVGAARVVPLGGTGVANVDPNRRP